MLVGGAWGGRWEGANTIGANLVHDGGSELCVVIVDWTN